MSSLCKGVLSSLSSWFSAESLAVGFLKVILTVLQRYKGSRLLSLLKVNKKAKLNSFNSAVVVPVTLDNNKE